MLSALFKILIFFPKLVFNQLSKTFMHATMRSLRFDLIRLRARLRTKNMFSKYLKDNRIIPQRLHLGCGRRLIPNWLNVDLYNSDIDIDICSNGLSIFEENYFQAITSEHVVEHLDMHEELPNLLDHLYRILDIGGVLWITTPSLQKIARSYLKDGARTLVQGRKKRFPDYTTRGYSDSIIVNDIFYQNGEHKNIFDFSLLEQLINNSKFTDIKEVDYEEFSSNHMEFPQRDDAEQTIYIMARKSI